MAAIGELARGGRRENSGRKRKYDSSITSQKGWNSQHKRIYLSLKIFEAWRDAKTEAGYEAYSDGDFACHLLSLEYRRREQQPRQHHKGTKTATTISESDEQVEKEGLIISTPIKDIHTHPMTIPSVSPILGRQEDSERFVDTDVSLNQSQSSSIDLGKSNTSMFTDDEGEITDNSSSEEDISLHDLTKSVLEELNAEQDNMKRQSDSDVMNEISDDDGPEDDISDDDGPENDISDDDGPENDIFEMVTENEEHETDDVNLQQQSHFTTECADTFGPHRRFTRGDEVYSMKKEYKMVKEKKFVCSLDLLLQIFHSRCQTRGCTAENQIQYHFIGVTVIVNSVCSEGHKYRFCSSPQVNDIYANNLQAATSLMFSGNQFSKIERMAKFLNLEFLSSSTYYRFQRLYLIPEINKWWSGMRKELLVEFADKEIIVSGDGQCDSPGFNDKNLCYFTMEKNTNQILDVDVLDKRHVGLVSPNMEKEAIQRCLDRLTKEVKVSEFVTDASTTVKALLRTQYENIVHSLDVWHKAKSIKKCLTKLGKPKAMKKVKDWSAHIITHFWHCSSACRKDEITSDEEALKVLKDMWIGLLHHICNEHEWIGGACKHDDGEHDETLPWFDRRDKDFLELQKVVLNPELLASFKYYTRFRHTGAIECANNLGLVYTPKQTSFSYRVYKARRQLAAIDWNFHLNLPQAKLQSGECMVTRKYNPRTRQWDIKKIKVVKGYEYIPVLTSGVLRRRAVDLSRNVTQKVALNTSDPGLISPTIAHVPPPATKEIAERRSRFKQ